MDVSHLIAKQTGGAVVCRPQHSVKAAATILRTHNIGAMPVCDENNRLVGVLSERDIARSIADHDAKALRMPVRALMTEKVIVCKASDDVMDAVRVMFQHKIRHLPVVEDEKVLGMISLRGAMEARLKTRKWTGGANPAGAG